MSAPGAGQGISWVDVAASAAGIFGEMQAVGQQAAGGLVQGMRTALPGALTPVVRAAVSGAMEGAVAGTVAGALERQMGAEVTRALANVGPTLRAAWQKEMSGAMSSGAGLILPQGVADDVARGFSARLGATMRATMSKEMREAFSAAEASAAAEAAGEKIATGFAKGVGGLKQTLATLLESGVIGDAQAAAAGQRLGGALSRGLKQTLSELSGTGGWLDALVGEQAIAQAAAQSQRLAQAVAGGLGANLRVTLERSSAVAADAAAEATISTLKQRLGPDLVATFASVGANAAKSAGDSAAQMMTQAFGALPQVGAATLAAAGAKIGESLTAAMALRKQMAEEFAAAQAGTSAAASEFGARVGALLSNGVELGAAAVGKFGDTLSRLWGTGAVGEAQAAAAGRRIGDALSGGLKQTIAELTGSGGIAAAIANATAQAGSQAVGNLMLSLAQSKNRAMEALKFEDLGMKLAPQFAEAGRIGAEAMGTGLQGHMATLVSHFMPPSLRPAIQQFFGQAGKDAGSAFRVTGATEFEEATRAMGGKMLSGWDKIGGEGSAAAANAVGKMSMAAKAGLVGLALVVSDMALSAVKNTMKLIGDEFAAFTKLGGDAGQALMGGFKAVVEGKMPDVQQIIGVGMEGIQTAIQMPLNAINAGLDATIGKIPILGSMVTAVTGEVQQVLGTVFSAIQQYTSIAGEFGEALLDIGNKWQQAARSIAGQTLGIEHLSEYLNMVRDIAASGDLVHFKDVADVVGELGQRLGVLDGGVGLTNAQIQELATTLAEGNELLGDTKINVDNLTAAITSFNIEGSKANDFLTYMINLARETGVSINDLNHDLDATAGAWQALGYNGEQAGYVMGHIQEVLGQPALQRFPFSLAHLQEELAKSGLSMQQFHDIAMAAIKGPGGEQAAAAFIEPFAGSAKAADTWVQIIKRIPILMGDVDAAMERDAAKLHAPIDGALQATKDLGNQLEVLSQQVLAALAPVGIGLVNALTGVGDKISNWLQTHQVEFIGFVGAIGEKLLGWGVEISRFLAHMLREMSGAVQFTKNAIVVAAMAADAALIMWSATWGMLIPGLHDVTRAAVAGMGALSNMLSLDIGGWMNKGAAGLDLLGNELEGLEPKLANLINRSQGAASMWEATRATFGAPIKVPGTEDFLRDAQHNIARDAPKLQQALSGSLEEGIKIDPEAIDQVTEQLSRRGISVDVDKATGQVRSFSAHTQKEMDDLQEYLNTLFGPDKFPDIIKKVSFKLDNLPDTAVKDFLTKGIGVPEELAGADGIHANVYLDLKGLPPDQQKTLNEILNFGGAPPGTTTSAAPAAPSGGVGRMIQQNWPDFLGPSLAGMLARLFFQSGGTVTGPGGTDRVPILATAGEKVMNLGASQRFGTILDWMNAQAFQAGGTVADAAGIPASMQGGALTGTPIALPAGINVITPQPMSAGDTLTSAGVPDKYQGDVQEAGVTETGVSLPTNLAVRDQSRKSAEDVMTAVGIPSNLQTSDGVAIDVKLNLAPGSTTLSVAGGDASVAPGSGPVQQQVFQAMARGGWAGSTEFDIDEWDRQNYSEKNPNPIWLGQGFGSRWANQIGGLIGMKEGGFPDSEWGPLSNLIQGESSWDPGAKGQVQPGGDRAFGLFQFLGHQNDKYGQMGGYSTNPYQQAHAGIQYIKDVYGTPTNAYSTWLSRSPHWYQKGGRVGLKEDKPASGQPHFLGFAGGGVPIMPVGGGLWSSPDSEWAHLIMRESSGRPNVTQSAGVVDVNTGGNEAEGLFQITPGTWTAHGGEEFGTKHPGMATPQQQAIVAARIIRANPSASDWIGNPPVSGREDPVKLLSALGPLDAALAEQARHMQHQQGGGVRSSLSYHSESHLAPHVGLPVSKTSVWSHMQRGGMPFPQDQQGNYDSSQMEKLTESQLWIWRLAHGIGKPNQTGGLLGFNGGGLLGMQEGGLPGIFGGPHHLGWQQRVEQFKKLFGFQGGGPVPGFVPGGLAAGDYSGDDIQGVDAEILGADVIAHQMGLKLTSGRAHHPVDRGYHPKGMAGDFSNGTDTPQEAQFATYMASNFKPNIAELIHGTHQGWDANFNINNGKFVRDMGGVPNVYDSGTLAGHHDHVHLAMVPGSSSALEQLATSGTLPANWQSSGSGLSFTNASLVSAYSSASGTAGKGSLNPVLAGLVQGVFEALGFKLPDPSAFWARVAGHQDDTSAASAAAPAAASAAAPPAATPDHRVVNVQAGGHIKGYHLPGRDTVPMSVPAGTFIMNRHRSMQYRDILDSMLGMAAGGMIPIITEPGERVIPPGTAPPGLLHAMNQGRLLRRQPGGGTDDQTVDAGTLPPGTKVFLVKGPGKGDPNEPKVPEPVGPNAPLTPPPAGWPQAIAPAGAPRPSAQAVETPYGWFLYPMDMPGGGADLTGDVRRDFTKWLHDAEKRARTNDDDQTTLHDASQAETDALTRLSTAQDVMTGLINQAKAQYGDQWQNYVKVQTDAAHASSDLAKADKELAAARKHEQETSKALAKAGERLHDAQVDQAEQLDAVPPWETKAKEAATTPDQNAAAMGSGLIKGMAQELGFGDVFGKPPWQWGIWKLFAGGASAALQIGNIFGESGKAGAAGAGGIGSAGVLGGLGGQLGAPPGPGGPSAAAPAAGGDQPIRTDERGLPVYRAVGGGEDVADTQGEYTSSHGPTSGSGMWIYNKDTQRYRPPGDKNVPPAKKDGGGGPGGGPELPHNAAGYYTTSDPDVFEQVGPNGSHSGKFFRRSTGKESPPPGGGGAPPAGAPPGGAPGPPGGAPSTRGYEPPPVPEASWPTWFTTKEGQAWASQHPGWMAQHPDVSTTAPPPPPAPPPPAPAPAPGKDLAPPAPPSWATPATSTGPPIHWSTDRQGWVLDRDNTPITDDPKTHSGYDPAGPASAGKRADTGHGPGAAGPTGAAGSDWRYQGQTQFANFTGETGSGTPQLANYSQPSTMDWLMHPARSAMLESYQRGDLRVPRDNSGIAAFMRARASQTPVGGGTVGGGSSPGGGLAQLIINANGVTPEHVFDQHAVQAVNSWSRAPQMSNGGGVPA
jgi:hypothetical protein